MRSAFGGGERREAQKRGGGVVSRGMDEPGMAPATLSGATYCTTQKVPAEDERRVEHLRRAPHRVHAKNRRTDEGDRQRKRRNRTHPRGREHPRHPHDRLEQQQIQEQQAAETSHANEGRRDDAVDEWLAEDEARVRRRSRLLKEDPHRAGAEHLLEPVEIDGRVAKVAIVSDAERRGDVGRFVSLDGKRALGRRQRCADQREHQRGERRPDTPARIDMHRRPEIRIALCPSASAAGAGAARSTSRRPTCVHHRWRRRPFPPMFHFTRPRPRRSNPRSVSRQGVIAVIVTSPPSCATALPASEVGQLAFDDACRACGRWLARCCAGNGCRHRLRDPGGSRRRTQCARRLNGAADRPRSTS